MKKPEAIIMIFVTNEIKSKYIPDIIIIQTFMSLRILFTDETTILIFEFMTLKTSFRYHVIICQECS